MELISGKNPLIIVVGSGGVGKTTLAASLGVLSAREGRDTLVMTFDPSMRLKQTLGVGEEARLREMPVAFDAPGTLHASLLDARLTFDRLIERYAPDEETRRRVLGNRFYQHLSGTLGGILEYMAVERLFEVASDGRYGQVVLDTPPTRQALDFLEAPKRIVGFLDSGALRVALKPWFDDEGRLRAASKWGILGRRAERFLDEVVGMDLLRDMAEFFQAFGPLYEGFRDRALEVGELLRSKQTLFVLVTGPGEERIPDTLFFARKLEEAGYNLGPIVVNRVHPLFLVDGAPPASGDPCRPTGWELLTWVGQRDRRGLVELAKLLSREQPLVDLPLLPDEPTDLPSLEAMGRQLEGRLAEWERYVSRTS
ncbi:MAG TPA: ArsA-related P-loop ATPase [Thermoanaerobaculia bacterium]|jgi:anion-transporting  ArsA/GET3 family ATPase|nr:ArsA-related P-loop ATPase [Thermoanaerobaculia bacterium]